MKEALRILVYSVRFYPNGHLVVGFFLLMCKKQNDNIKSENFVFLCNSFDKREMASVWRVKIMSLKLTSF